MSYNPNAIAATPQIFTAVDNTTGLPLAGGQLYTYASGTITPQATYTDNTLTTQLPNPVILDNYGQAVIWLGTSPYRFNLLNAAGVQQAHYPQDNIQPSSFTSFTTQLAAYTTTSQGAGLVGYNSGLSYTANTIGAGLQTFESNLSASTGATLISDNLNVTNSVTQNQHQINYEVNVMKFGAKCNGTTDDTVAVQNAINYCLASMGTLVAGEEVISILKIPGPCLLSSTINIDRVTSGGPYSYFRIIGEGNTGGFVSTTSGLVMFSSTEPGGSSQRSDLISFERIHFNGNGTSTATMQAVLNPIKFERISFINCWFGNIGLGYSGASYLQSLYLRNCRVVGMAGGQFLQATDFDDVEISQCMFEGMTNILQAAGALIISTGVATGFRFHDNLAESINVGVLSLTNASGVEISGNYIEAVGQAGTTTYPFIYCVTANGLNIEGNYVTTGVSQQGRYEVQIANPNAVHSAGNYFTSYSGPGTNGGCAYSLGAFGANVSLGHGDISTSTVGSTYVNNTNYVVPYFGVPASQSALKVNNGATTTYTVSSFTDYVYITTSASSLAITFPTASAALNGVKVTVVLSANVATLTWAGGSFVGAPSSGVANTPYKFIYNSANTQWLPA